MVKVEYAFITIIIIAIITLGARQELTNSTVELIRRERARTDMPLIAEDPKGRKSYCT